MGYAYRAEGIVLKGSNFGEADRILTIFTREEGKVSSIARGAKKVKSTMRAGTQILCRSDFSFYRGRGSLDTITQCQIIESYPQLRNDLGRYSFALYLAEICDTFLPLHNPENSVYLLLTTGLYLLEGEDPLLVLCFLQIKLLNLAGFKPDLDFCSGCKDKLGADVFVSGASGIFCSDCAADKENKFKLSKGALNLWQYLTRANLRVLKKIKVNSALKRELFYALKIYWEFVLEKHLKTSDFIVEIKALEEA